MTVSIPDHWVLPALGAIATAIATAARWLWRVQRRWRFNMEKRQSKLWGVIRALNTRLAMASQCWKHDCPMREVTSGRSPLPDVLPADLDSLPDLDTPEEGAGAPGHF